MWQSEEGTDFWEQVQLDFSSTVHDSYIMTFIKL